MDLIPFHTEKSDVSRSLLDVNKTHVLEYKPWHKLLLSKSPSDLKKLKAALTNIWLKILLF